MIPFFLSFVTSFMSLQLLLKTPWRKRVVALEDERSMHKGAIPRFGGIGIILGITAGWLLLGVDSWWLLLLLGLSIAFISFLDDLYQLPVLLRLTVQFLMAFVFVYVEFGFSQTLIAVLLLVSVVWMVNLYNFMDGLDGLAGGMAVFGFSTFALAAYLAASDLVMLKAAFIVVAATLAFLRWNLHPAKLFLGDVGSTSIGFIAAAFAFYGWREHMWPFWFPVIVFLPFIADATVTLFKRLINGENIWQAHNKHYYQRLVRMGWAQPMVSITYYLAMAISSATALILLKTTLMPPFLGILLLCGIVAGLLSAIDWRWRKYQRNQKPLTANSKRSARETEERFGQETNNVLPLLK